MQIPQSKDPVLEPRQEAVGHVFPPRHALLHGIGAQQARAEHDIGLAALDRVEDLGQQSRVVLIVRVDHHHDIGAGPKRFTVTGLLIGPVT